MTTLHTLSSGSSGNALVLSCGESHLLLDAGISCRRITAALAELGLAPADLTAVLITHTHADHIAGLQTLLKRTDVPVLASARTARDNLEGNGLAGEILAADLRSAPLPAGAFDLVVSNPPYFPLGSGGSGGPARSEECCTLEEVCAAAARLVRNGGRFALCHRPERLADVVCALRASGLEPKRLKLVSHGPGHPPALLLVEGVRQGRPGLTIEE